MVYFKYNRAINNVLQKFAYPLNGVGTFRTMEAIKVSFWAPFGWYASVYHKKVCNNIVDDPIRKPLELLLGAERRGWVIV